MPAIDGYNSRILLSAEAEQLNRAGAVIGLGAGDGPKALCRGQRTGGNKKTQSDDKGQTGGAPWVKSAWPGRWRPFPPLLIAVTALNE